jgi:hypothetical protein
MFGALRPSDQAQPYFPIADQSQTPAEAIARAAAMRRPGIAADLPGSDYALIDARVRSVPYPSMVEFARMLLAAASDVSGQMGAANAD